MPWMLQWEEELSKLDELLGLLAAAPPSRRSLCGLASAAGARLEIAEERTRGVTRGSGQKNRGTRSFLGLFLLRNVRPALSRLTNGRDSLFSAFHLLAATGLQRAALVLLHDFVDLALALSRKGRGKPDAPPGGTVVSDFAGQFALKWERTYLAAILVSNARSGTDPQRKLWTPR